MAEVGRGDRQRAQRGEDPDVGVLGEVGDFEDQTLLDEQREGLQRVLASGVAGGCSSAQA